MSAVIAEAVGLTKEFRVESSSFRSSASRVHAVTDVSFTIKEGETFALVGESGCGKSTLGRLMVGLLPPTSGKVLVGGQDLAGLNAAQMKAKRREMQIIFQDPYASLNPRMSVLDIVAEPLYTHKMATTRQQARSRVKELLEMCGLRSELMNRYPHQFSGGQRQRIGIARALALNPKLVICDEPVSALDVSIQSQIINLLSDLQEKMGLTYLFISHDLSVVRYLSDTVCVMFLGRVCEMGPTEDVYENPHHPYTRFLLEAVPKPDPLQRKEKQVILGEIPSPIDPPSGCRFHKRCPYAQSICSEAAPELEDYDGRKVACHRKGMAF